MASDGRNTETLGCRVKTRENRPDRRPGEPPGQREEHPRAAHAGAAAGQPLLSFQVSGLSGKSLSALPRRGAGG